MRLPVVSRLGDLGLSGLFRMMFAFFFVFTEAFVRIVMVFVPQPVTSILDYARAQVVKSGTRLIRGYKDPLVSPTMDMGAMELINYHGYRAEQHVVQTADGYILTLHRVIGPKGNPTPDPRRPPILIQHGLMQTSEAFLITKDALAYFLVDHGYDVWLGNNRGNCYSMKHVHLSSSNAKFWDFCLDHYASYDFPANIDYILKATGHPRVGYIGFSQGTAQAFAALSLDHELSKKIALFVALAPASRARGLSSGLLSNFVHLAPDSIFLILGNKGVMPSTLFWRNLLSRNFWVTLIDFCCHNLFGWSMRNMSRARKCLLYAHIYSFTSVKSIVHWFQIVATNRFQMYDESFAGKNNNKYRGIVVPLYPINQIKAPLALFYGGSDQLPDFEWMLSNVPEGTYTYEEPSYEHLDLFWADTASTRIFPQVADLMAAAFDPKGDIRQTLGRYKPTPMAAVSPRD